MVVYQTRPFFGGPIRPANSHMGRLKLQLSSLPLTEEDNIRLSEIYAIRDNTY